MHPRVAPALTLILLLGACASPSVTPSARPSVATNAPTLAASQVPTPTGGPTPTGVGATPQPSIGLIPQPSRPAGLTVAPDSARVDLVMPTFSDPSTITNPLFPVSAQESVLLMGVVDDMAFRTEVTLLADHRIIEWAGQPIEALVSQYVAYLDGRIHEVAYDFYAQDDAGNVWYLGEDVFNFADGSIVDTHGTWLAGRDGPGAMIMPADPQVGNVYRPENIPGFVFEEVTVKAVDQDLDGPLGTVAGGLVIEELHMDGTTEDKTFAPGYGEFFTGGGGDVEALALAVPTDALGAPVPGPVATLTDGALSLIEQARQAEWEAAATSLDEIRAAWDTVPVAETPTSLQDVMEGWLRDLAAAVDAQDASAAQRAAIETARSGFDLHLRHRPAVEVDLARLDLWAAELRLDADNGSAAAVNADVFAIDYVRDRIQRALSDADMGALDAQLEEFSVAIGDGDFEAVAEMASALRELVATLGG